ncbi:MAG: prepilin-type N-terminal cleavage/methylation domain-containing protein [Verrucomicrobiota bacterium]
MLGTTQNRRGKSEVADAGTGAFSLVEVLVVIVIVGLLSVLLLPAVLKVREGANRSKSVANLRSIHVALMGYVSDHNQRLPLDFFALDGRITWAGVLVRDGYLPPLPASGSFLHPLFDPGVDLGKRSQSHIANYGINRNITGWDYRSDPADPNVSALNLPGPISTISNPSEKYLVMGAGYNSITEGYLSNPSTPFFYLPGRSENKNIAWAEEYRRDATGGRYGKFVNILTPMGNVITLPADSVSTSAKNWER